MRSIHMLCAFIALVGQRRHGSPAPDCLHLSGRRAIETYFAQVHAHLPRLPNGRVHTLDHAIGEPV